MINLCENAKVKKSKNSFNYVFEKVYINNKQQFLFVGYGCEGTEDTINYDEVLYAYMININEIEDFANIDKSEFAQFYHIQKSLFNTEKPWKQDWIALPGGLKNYDKCTLMNKYRAILQKIKLLNTNSFGSLLKEWLDEYPVGPYNAQTALSAQVLDSFFSKYEYVLISDDENLRKTYKKYLEKRDKFIKLREEHKKNKSEGIVTT